MSPLGRLGQLFGAALALLAALAVGQYLRLEPPHSDHYLVSLSPLLLPLLSPLLHAKLAFLPTAWDAAVQERVATWLLVPSQPFDVKRTPPPPDYTDEASWFALGHREDTADWYPEGHDDGQATARADAFYVQPTTMYSGAAWNAAHNATLSNFLTSEGILPSQAGAFNAHCRVFAPAFRQMTAGGYYARRAGRLAEGQAALELAYSDVRRAFLHFLATWNAGRPIVLVGHSQGTLLLRMLLAEFFEKPHPDPATRPGTSRTLLRERLVAAYLVGMQVWDGAYRNGTATVPLCDSPTATGCVISWMSYAVDGEPDLFISDHGLLAGPPPLAHERQVCTNPLSWRVGCEHVPSGSPCDNARVPREKNPGALHIYQPMTNFLGALGYRRWQDRFGGAGWFGNSWRAPAKHLVDAQCLDGYLRIREPARYGYGDGVFPAWQAFAFPGKNYHAYDYNLYWESVRHNVGDRVEAFLGGAAMGAA